jgi:hypothetical protein
MVISRDDRTGTIRRRLRRISAYWQLVPQPIDCFRSRLGVEMIVNIILNCRLELAKRVI